MSSKIAEAEKHIQAAEKCMKTSFTKWKPDPEGAASEYEKAGVAFKNGKALDKAKGAYELAADCQMQCKQLFHAAKSYEQAAFIAKEMGNFVETAKLVERASNMYIEAGTPDTASLALLRAAKMIETQLVDRAVNMYMKAAHIYETENNHRQAADAIRSAPRLLIRNKKYDEAVNALQKELNYNAEAENFEITHRLVVCMVLLHLFRGDCVAADKAYKHGYVYSGFSDSDEAAVTEQLLDALNQGDENTATNTLSMPMFTYLDNDFSKLARDLRQNPPEELFMSGGGGGRGDSGAEAAGSNPTLGNDEYDEDDLC